MDREKVLMEQMNIDPIQNWLSDKENQTLSPAGRNQMALERFLGARQSKWQKEQDLERLLAYEYEKSGYAVQFIPLQKEFPEFLRVLKVQKEGATLMVQCRQTPFLNQFIEKILLNFFFLGVETFRDLSLKDTAGPMVLRAKNSPKNHLSSRDGDVPPNRPDGDVLGGLSSRDGDVPPNRPASVPEGRSLSGNGDVLEGLSDSKLHFRTSKKIQRRTLNMSSLGSVGAVEDAASGCP